MENQPTTSRRTGHMPSPPEHVATFDALCERTRARQQAAMAERDRKATVMHAQAVSLARQLSAYVERTHLVLPTSLVDTLAAFDRADEAYMASIATPIAAVS